MYIPTFEISILFLTALRGMRPLGLLGLIGTILSLFVLVLLIKLFWVNLLVFTPYLHLFFLLYHFLVLTSTYGIVKRLLAVC
jgi:hypothetical protein